LYFIEELLQYSFKLLMSHHHRDLHAPASNVRTSVVSEKLIDVREFKVSQYKDLHKGWSGRVVFAVFLSEIEAPDNRTDIRSLLAGFAS
jgi:hypothetical protein